MTDYNKLKVTELKEQLTARGLPTTGKKDDLVSRLVADDAAKASNQSNGESSAESVKEVAPAPAPAPSATETPDEKETTKDTAVISPAAAPESSATAPIEGEKKKFTFKRLADEFDTPAPKAPESVKPEESKTTEPAESFAAGLAATDASSELEKRKKRAARFGVPVAESIKLAERAKRFASDGDDSKKDTTIKALDSALGENRGKKRGPETRIQNEPPKKSKDTPKPITKGILADPTEKSKAEARAKRFG